MKVCAQLTLWFLAVLANALADPQPVVAIQPLGKVKAEDIATVKAGITALYAVSVEILPEKPIPAIAWKAARKRHNADDIVETLSAELPARFNKIIGLTAVDISAINSKGKDCGIMGLGQLTGKACVISSFRLRSGGADEKLFCERLVKVANHELGHTFGRDHCRKVGCLMQEKRSMVSTIDGESGKPCASCAARLPMAD